MLSNNYKKVISDYEDDRQEYEKTKIRNEEMNKQYPKGYDPPEHRGIIVWNTSPSGSGGNKQKTKKQKKNIKRRPTKKQYSKIKKGRRTFHNIRHSNHNTTHRKNKKYMTGGGELTREEIEAIKNQVTDQQMQISEMKDNINRAHEIWKLSSTNDDMLENDICQYVKNKYDKAVSDWNQAKDNLVEAGDDSQKGEEAAEAPAEAAEAQAEVLVEGGKRKFIKRR